LLDLTSRELVKYEDSQIVFYTAVIRVIVSRSTLVLIYPHILQNESLVQRIIGKELVLPVHGYMQFDESRRVTFANLQMDYIGAWSKLCNSLEEVAALVDGAHIEENGMMPMQLLQATTSSKSSTLAKKRKRVAAAAIKGRPPVNPPHQGRSTSPDIDADFVKDDIEKVGSNKMSVNFIL